jgi:iron complex outermembrane receptor protein
MIDERLRRVLPILLGLALAMPLTVAGEEPTEDEQDSSEAEAGETKGSGYSETVVVTASRTETPLHEAPSAVTVLGADQIATLPVDDYGDLTRNVPGLNVVQFSAAEVQFNTRTASGNLSQGQQILVDGRSVLYDFNGIMTLAGIPLDFDDIERIEAVRGPGSAVWGANATNGVVNIITKSPRDAPGTRLKLGVGEFDTTAASLSHSGVAGDVAYRVTGSWYQQDDPYDRPTGTIPGTESPADPEGTPYPPFPNEGTRQPKFDFRVDWDLGDGSVLGFSGGYGAFSGVTYTPIGPYSWDEESNSWYGKVEWRRGSLEVRAHATALDVEGSYLLIPDPAGGLLAAAFAQEAYHLEAVDTRLVAGRHVLTYGANLRTSRYDLDIAPQGDSRDEIGGFIQDDMRFGDKWRWLVGVRVDDIDTMGTELSPRTSLMFEPSSGQTLRLSWNRAFRAPTVVQNNIEILNVYEATVPDGAGGTVDLVVPLPGIPNSDLDAESQDSFELGWIGSIGERTTLSVSIYRDDIEDVIQFVPASFYSSSNPVPGWPLDPGLLDVPPPDGFAGLFPATLQYQNIGEIENRGVEASADFRVAKAWRVWANASWQDEPEVSGIQPTPMPDGTLVYPINLPPEWRANAGVVWSAGRAWVDLSGNYQDSAFWTDVLDSRFWGPTDSFAQLHLGAGYRLRGDTIELSIRAQNVTDEEVQQHVWGDLLGRKVTGQIALRF